MTPTKTSPATADGDGGYTERDVVWILKNSLMGFESTLRKERDIDVDWELMSVLAVTP